MDAPDPVDDESPGLPPQAEVADAKNKMDIGIILIWLLAGALIVVALVRGEGTLTTGFRGSWQAMIQLLPLLAGVFIIIGFADALLPKELIARLMGGESGLRGILIASGMGIVTPGGPFVSYPLVATLYQSGAAVGPLVAFVTAWALGSVSRLPLEIGLVGLRLTAIRVASSLIFPPIAGLIAGAIVKALNI